MVLHGVKDGTVPVDQARRLKRAMERTGTDRLLTYKEYQNEGHSLTIPNWVDAFERSLSFFDECV